MFLLEAEEIILEVTKPFANRPILEFNIDDNNDVSFYRIYNPDIRL